MAQKTHSLTVRVRWKLSEADPTKMVVDSYDIYDGDTFLGSYPTADSAGAALSSLLKQTYNTAVSRELDLDYFDDDNPDDDNDTAPAPGI